MTRPRTLAIAAVLALSAVGSPAAAAQEGIQVFAGEADEHGCSSAEVWNGDTLVKTLPADPGPLDRWPVQCATYGRQRHLPNGRLLFEWTHYLLWWDTGGCCVVRTDLWASDGTTDGTVPIISWDGDGDHQWMLVGRTAYISVLPRDRHGDGWCGNLTMTRGTLATTHTIESVGFKWLDEEGEVPALPFIQRLGGHVYFSASSHPFDGGGWLRDGREVWSSNGTRRGTVMLNDIHPGPLGSNPQDMAVVGWRLLFTANDGNGRVRWISDGTRKGTRKAVRP